MSDLVNTINKTDYSLLEALAIRECTTPFCSVRVDQLASFSGQSLCKVRNTLKLFMLMGFVKEGNKDKRSKTYYITTVGEDHFLAVFNYTIEDLELLRDNHFEAEKQQDNTRSNPIEAECSIGNSED